MGENFHIKRDECGETKRRRFLKSAGMLVAGLVAAPLLKSDSRFPEDQEAFAGREAEFYRPLFRKGRNLAG